MNTKKKLSKFELLQKIDDILSNACSYEFEEKLKIVNRKIKNRKQKN